METIALIAYLRVSQSLVSKPFYVSIAYSISHVNELTSSSFFKYQFDPLNTKFLNSGFLLHFFNNSFFGDIDKFLIICPKDSYKNSAFFSLTCFYSYSKCLQKVMIACSFFSISLN